MSDDGKLDNQKAASENRKAMEGRGGAASEFQVVHQYKHSQVREAIPLPDGRVVLLINRELFLWNPRKETLEYFNGLPPIDWINMHEGNTLLFVCDNRIVVVFAATKEHIVYESLSDETILQYILCRNETVAFITNDGVFHLWDPYVNHIVAKELPDPQDFKDENGINVDLVECFETNRFLVVVDDKRVIDFKL